MEDQKRNGEQELDWELSEDYYQEETGKKELRLEDFLEPEEGQAHEAGLNSGSDLAKELEEMAERVRQIMELSGAGRSAAQIASELFLDEQQVQDILVCVQSFPEDDPLAVARLMVLG